MLAYEHNGQLQNWHRMTQITQKHKQQIKIINKKLDLLLKIKNTG